LYLFITRGEKRQKSQFEFGICPQMNLKALSGGDDEIKISARNVLGDLMPREANLSGLSTAIITFVALTIA